MIPWMARSNTNAIPFEGKISSRSYLEERRKGRRSMHRLLSILSFRKRVILISLPRRRKQRRRGGGPFAFASSRIQRYVLGTAARSRDRIDKECATRRTVDKSENLGKILSLDFIHKVGSSKSSVCYATGKLSLHGGIRIMEMRSMVSSVDRAARMEIGSRVEFEIFISILRKVSRASGIFPLGWKTWEDDVWMEMQIVCGCRQWSTVGWD